MSKIYIYNLQSKKLMTTLINPINIKLVVSNAINSRKYLILLMFVCSMKKKRLLILKWFGNFNKKNMP